MSWSYEVDAQTIDVVAQPGGFYWSTEGSPIAFLSFEDFLIGGPPSAGVPEEVLAELRAHAGRETPEHGRVRLRVVAHPEDLAVELMFVRFDHRSLAAFHCEARPQLPLTFDVPVVAPGAHRVEATFEVGGRRFEMRLDLEMPPHGTIERTFVVSATAVQIAD